MLFTDGAKFLANQAGAYWLIDEIAIIQPLDKRVATEEFQVWKLTVRPDRTATLTCDDGNGNIVVTREIGFTDFPLNEVMLYFTNNVIYRSTCTVCLQCRQWAWLNSEGGRTISGITPKTDRASKTAETGSPASYSWRSSRRPGHPPEV